MKIGPDIAAAAVPSMPNPSGAEKSYRDIIADMYTAKPYRSRDEINESDASLQAFKDDLTTKGALRFFVEFNLEKIEEMVEKYRAELEKFSEENPEIPMDIGKMVSDYRKQLMEQFMNAQDAEKAQMLNPNRAVSELMLQLSEQKFVQEKTPLESLLHATGKDRDHTVLI